MKNDFERIQDIILGINRLDQVEVCEILIKNFKTIRGEEGRDYSYTLLGMLEAVKQLKF